MSGCPTCGGKLRRGHLMCGICWSNVPRALRLAVNRAWHAWLLTPAGPDGAARQRMADYVKARDAAIESVMGGGS